MARNDLQRLGLEVFEFVVLIDDVSSAVLANIDSFDRPTVAKLVTPGAYLTLNAALTESGLPKTILDVAANDALLAMDTPHATNGIPRASPTGMRAFI